MAFEELLGQYFEKEKDDYRKRMPQYTYEAFKANEELLEMIRDLSERKNATPTQISLAWILGKKPYIVPISGSRKIERIKENFDAGNINLTQEEVEAIDTKLDQIPTSDVFGGSAIKE